MKPAHEMPVDPDSDFGIVMAPVDGKGTWAAVKELRAALRKLRPDRSAHVVFIDALDGDGRPVSLPDPGVAVLVVGYSLTPESPSAIRSKYTLGSGTPAESLSRLSPQATRNSPGPSVATPLYSPM